jgi:hypothetical protein
VPIHLCVRELVFLLPRRARRTAVVRAACDIWGHDRLTLEKVDTEAAFPGFGDAQVVVSALPLHHWASPLGDLVALTKLAIVNKPRRILEIGSFQGHAALMLAENTPAETTITTVDILEDHGAVYRDGPFRDRITRHVGTVSTLPDTGPYDLIFVDADHRREEVEHDSAAAYALVAPGGLIVWHDYCDSMWVNELNRVPEVLAEHARRLPIKSLPGTRLAVYRVPG